MASLAASVFALACGVVVVFHLCLVAGAPWGHLTMGGRWPGRLPGRIRFLSLAQALILLVCVSVIWGGAGGPVARWLVVALMALSALANGITPSRPERRLWAPVAMVMFLSALIVTAGI